MKIIDNFISVKEQDELLEYVNSNQFPYRLHPTNIDQGKRQWVHAPTQLTHHLFMYDQKASSPHLKIIRPLFDAIVRECGDITLFRAKVNLTSPCPPFNSYEPHTPHVDLGYDDGTKIDHMVCIYYINESDGPTIFFDKNWNEEDTVYPRKGRAIIFDGNTFHAGSSPVQYPFRIVMNIDFRQGVGQIP
jgi:hypothetical protein